VTSELKNIPAAGFYGGKFYVRANRCIELGREYAEGYGVINLFSFRLPFFMNLVFKLCRRTKEYSVRSKYLYTITRLYLVCPEVLLLSS